MIAAQKFILEQLDETEEDTFKLSDSLVNFGFENIEKGNYHDTLNRNVLTNKGRTRI